MATESPLIHDGGHLILSTAYDARRSSITGTTLNGPNGSAQFFPVFLTSTMTDFYVGLSTGGFAQSTLNQCVGILQNTPKGGEIANVAIFGVTKALAGSTSIVRGTPLSVSSTAAGYVVPYSTGVGGSIGFAYENPAAVGNVFTMFLFGGRGLST